MPPEDYLFTLGKVATPGHLHVVASPTIGARRKIGPCLTLYLKFSATILWRAGLQRHREDSDRPRPSGIERERSQQKRIPPKPSGGGGTCLLRRRHLPVAGRQHLPAAVHVRARLRNFQIPPLGEGRMVLL